MKNHAKFTAEIAKGISIKETNVEVKLLIPLKSAQEHLVFLSSNQGEKVNVFLGDPQAALDFGEEEEAMYQKYTGRYVTADSSGVVTKVENPDVEDENQQKLFDQDLKHEDDGANDEQDGGKPDGENISEQEKPSSGLDGDVPDWMSDGGDSGGREMEFTEDNDHQDPEGETSAGDDATGDTEISKEELEEYILQNRPAFPDDDLDFPALVEQRRNGATWMGISREIGIPSSQLNSKFRKYKDYVKKLMKDGGAA